MLASPSSTPLLEFLRDRVGVSPAMRAVAVVLFASILFGSIAPLSADSDEAVMYRIFLKSGKVLVSFGDYVRLDDTLVFSLPLAAAGGAPPLQLVSIPAAAVDWERTDEYAHAARFTHYVETRGETDFARMSEEVAQALNAIGVTKEPARRLEIAERARRTLVDWPTSNYGYRSDEVRQYVAILDEVIRELRTSLGSPPFQLEFVAMTASPPTAPLMPAPTFQEIVEQVLAVVSLTPAPAERLSLLRSAAGMIDGDAALNATSWGGATRARVEKAIVYEVTVDRSYADLTRRMVRDAAARGATADVRGIERLIAQLSQHDARLGTQRPDVVASLSAELRRRLHSAQELRLIRDRWEGRAPVLRAYAGPVHQAMTDILGRSALDDIKRLAGPSARSLGRIENRIKRARLSSIAILPPDELRPVHARFVSGLQFAQTAVDLRRRAVASGDLQLARDASSAAAASVLLLTGARDELQNTLKGPEAARP